MHRHVPVGAGALLFDARQLFEQQNAKADEALRSIVGQLPEAVASCVDAAGADLDPIRQAALMKVGNTHVLSLCNLAIHKQVSAAYVAGCVTRCQGAAGFDLDPVRPTPLMTVVKTAIAQPGCPQTGICSLCWRL